MTRTVTKAVPHCEAARQWREALGLTRRELSEKIGFSERAIRAFEVDTKRGDAAWKRYRLACAAVEYDWMEFNWGT